MYVQGEKFVKVKDTTAQGPRVSKTVDPLNTVSNCYVATSLA